MTIREQIHQNALAIILEANPQIIRESEAMTEEGLCGMSRAEFRHQQLTEILEKEARLRQLDAWEYQLMLAEDAGIDVSAVRKEDRHTIAATLGFDDLL
ncbi:DUF6388 family protein [Pseudomonas taiwanensis]|uniref:DUF6388 family protein n=1 Tax=Pseudomonas taiwanensis TaxID=470150 RepID=UPI0016475569|nr:DUF6388 family protein [Pseudomonas taiwanensis]MBC3493601.1 hypothetical protein [Pseudomonas taiwanensis]